MKLVDCFIPLLALLQQFQRAPSGDLPGLAQQFDAAIGGARQQARDAGHAEADIEEALFAVAAWADEAILASDWTEAAQWQRHLLQRRYFNISNAGVAFFTRLDALGEQSLAVREVYYLCLGMGFAGRYGYDRNQKALTDIKRANLASLLEDEDGSPGEAGKLLFPDGYGTSLPQADAARKSVKHRNWTFSSLTLNALLVPLLVLIVLYGIYHVVIWQLVGSILPQIRT